MSEARSRYGARMGAGRSTGRLDAVPLRAVIAAMALLIAAVIAIPFLL